MSLRLLAGALAEMRQGIVCLTTDGTITLTNRSADTIFGYSPDELIGQPIQRLIPEPLGRAHPDFWKNFWTNPESGPIGGNQGPVLGLRKDFVQVPIELALNVVLVSDAQYVVASISDITERIHLESEMSSATHEHLVFQRLIADIAGRFANVKAANVDETIIRTLGEIAETLQLDRAVVWRFGRDDAQAVPLLYWVVPGHASPPEPYATSSLPWVLSRLKAGEPCWFTRLEDIPDPVDRETFRDQGPVSGALFPMPLGDESVLMAFGVSSLTREKEWTPVVVERLRLVASIIGQALARTSSLSALENAVDELHRLRELHTDDDVEMRREVRTQKTARLIVSDSPVIKHAFNQVQQVAPTPATVLLLGETGVGKEVFAQAIHDLSPRHNRPLVRVSCGAIPAALIESELFGRERGAYTGALSRQIGRFEAANQSTLFLDEIGELQPEVQVKLLRVLQERVIERLGSTQPIKVDVRIIAATHRDLEKAVSEGAFREDLYYRLNVFPVVVPPLRERKEDLPGLIWAFVDEFSRLFGKTIDSVSKESMKELQRYAWPGNVRELRNVIERAVILSTGPHLVVPAPKALGRTLPQSAMTLEALEIEHIRGVLESTNWRVRGTGGAAARLGLKPTTLESRMAKLGITRRVVS